MINNLEDVDNGEKSGKYPVRLGKIYIIENVNSQDLAEHHLYTRILIIV